MPQKSFITERQLEILISNVLRTGVTLAAFLVIVGGAIYFFQDGRALPNYQTFQGEPDELRHAEKIIQYARSFHGKGLIQLGLLILVGTPVARVVFSMVGFLLQRDQMYVIFTAIVLFVLCVSLLVGR
jgi:uncharacterized membrane protein